MAIAINPAQGACESGRADRSVSRPAEVWDVESRTNGRKESSDVRTLGAGTRTGELRVRSVEDVTDVEAGSFEPRRENRESVLLGGLFAATLIVGSFIGGAFGQTEVAPSGVPPQDAVVSAR
ncbi:hypothetical protein [Corynebacterium sp. Marseille-P4321]|uniref:hypothetical protein n=1 Tax=Corynebacterium sp. Marseille-P4321 TaxID=2736603 RepID=UPI00158D1B26|nr:hypothetical protein [Corynebacterium sp. Marseille-P4321]